MKTHLFNIVLSPTSPMDFETARVFGRIWEIFFKAIFETLWAGAK